MRTCASTANVGLRTQLRMSRGTERMAGMTS